MKLSNDRLTYKDDLSYYQQSMISPFGQLLIKASEDGVTQLTLIDSPITFIHPNVHTKEAILQLKAYFDRKCKNFELIIDFSRHTDFQQRIWTLLCKIPYGTTISYLQLASQYGDMKAIRAVGTANGRNPLPIIIPCHRVIGSDGSLTGYSLGLDMKRQLLALEIPHIYGIIQSKLDF